jgi:hypothetical protein
MNWDAIGAIGELVGAAGVIVSLVYLAVQVKGNTAVVSAQSRHSLSEFALQMSMFRAGHAEQSARMVSGAAVSPADQQFQYWSHMQVALHAETYFHHHQLGMMPDSHWLGYQRFMEGYVSTPGFADFWRSLASGFSEDFSRWLSALVDKVPASEP